MKLNEKAFALSVGIIAAVESVIGFGYVRGGGMMGFGGFNLVGLVYTFLIGAILGYAFAWLYNTFAKS